jgi:threonine aldolase
MSVETNIVVAHLHSKFDNHEFVEKLKAKGVLSIPFGKGRIRMVTHLDISNEEIEKVVDSIKF